jgi:predicted ATPase/DNA-binding NarL/FixJ family response regulator
MRPVARDAADNLPAALTSFVGRSSEKAAVKQALGQSRLVTLVGTGGVGKTRLALSVAAEVRRAFSDGVWFVDLSAVQDEALVASTVAGALHLQSRSRQWAPSALARQLADRSVLVLLDNCEQLRHACAVLVDTLLRECPALRVLATSRQALDIAGEHLITVRPLAAPTADNPPPAAVLPQYDAVVLFTERAQAVAPDFRLDADNSAAVAALCARLDGIPLALELAAARLRVLSPQQLLDRVDEHSRLLRSDSAVAPPRHRSLHSLIDWSYGLCLPEEQALWSRLTVFPGSFDVEAAEQVCGGEDLPREQVFDLLSGLVEKSVLLTMPTAERMRYRMPETIRAFGHGQLAAAGEERELRRRHRDYFATIYLPNEAWFGPRQRELMKGMVLERDNYRAALSFCLSERDEPKVAAQLVGAITAETMVLGFLSEGRYWMQRVLAVVDEHTPELARLEWLDGWHALNQGDVEGGTARLLASRELADELGDHADWAKATAFLGVAALMRGDVDTGVARFQEALARVDPEDPQGFVLVTTGLGFASFLGGDVERATDLIEDAIAESVRHGESWHRAEALADLSIVTWHRGDTRRATELSLEALRIERSFENAVGTANALEVLAWIAATDRQHPRASRLLGAAEALWHAMDASLFPYLRDYHAECERAIRRVMGDRAFETSHRAGLDSPLAENVAFALGEGDPAAGADPGMVETGLTRRERQIAELVANGLSNREIAAALVISKRTAEGHVEHILAKLGFSSRAQVAAWVAEHRPSASVR